MAAWKLYFDGACPAGIPHFGWVLMCDEIVKDKGHGPVDLLGPERTTNIAEYGGLVHGLAGCLTWLNEGDTITVYGDSQLVIRQMNGWYRVKKEHLVPYVRKAREFLKVLADKKVAFTLDWIPREKNTKADELSKRTTPLRSDGK